ncbi:alkene reductase [Nocardiopsis metallicus]|uniref:N-ethylmaleimide reductase n=1 Tax=Nocardiopsis metallicus TaxID=179819 RepID=A0A840VYX5_9ACTN|nr:alkene reductase [Nocardiopsis metallicus]MBB5489700.1 N-ethylmaleimide reductase [Nocardiopsis metallicus]
MSEFFTKTTLGRLELPNRLVMAPMTRARSADGLVTDLTAEYYAQRASAGLIISESVQPSVIGQGFLGTPGLHSAEQVKAWRKVTDAVHAKGGRIVAQITHTGRIGHPVIQPDGALPLAPSPIASGEKLFTMEGLLDHPEPREMTTADIEQTVADHVSAARNAVEAGFDGVEIHGGNGFLVHQFLADNTNVRTDSYGGSLTNRVRFAVEVVTAVGEAIGLDRTGLRISPGNPYNNIVESDPLALYLELARALPESLAFLHISEIVTREVTKALREAWSGPIVLNPHPTADSFPSSPETALEALREGLADAVALAELWLANPDLPARIAAGGPYNVSDSSTHYGGDAKGYTDYPTLNG